MIEISFRLIRNCNPNANFDEINDIISINLNNQNISNIDNLELFSHIKELYLANNKIRKVENLECFNELELLDLSNNDIDADSLLQSISSIPKTLQTINLSGNPCIFDEEVLTTFQDAFPELGIVIEEVDEEHEGDNDIIDDHQENIEDSKEDNEITDLIIDYNQNLDINKTYDRKEYLSSDEVLHQIVERKSKFQSYSKYNIEATITDLNNELAEAIESSENIHSQRKNRIHSKENHINNSANEYLMKIENKKKELLYNHQQNSIQATTKFDELMKKLKKTSSEYINNIKNSQESSI